MSDTKTDCVFIVGCRRSGTTWLATLLAQHPRLVALQQSGFFLVLDKVTSWFRTRRKYGGTVLSSASSSDELARTSLSEVFPVERYYDLVQPLVRELYGRIAATSPETTGVVDHQPEHVRLWRDIHAVLPEAHFVHVIRDPRAVFSSYVHSAKSWSSRQTFTRDPVVFAEEWVRDVTEGRSIAAETDRCIEVRYEQMREEGAPGLLRVYEALGLPADLAQSEAAIEACSIDKMRKSATHGPSAFFRRGAVQGWKEELSASDIEAVEYVCADLMDELGYERVNKSFSQPPAPVRRRQKRRRRMDACRAWIRDGDGWVKVAVRGVVRRVPGLRRLAWNTIKW